MNWNVIHKKVEKHYAEFIRMKTIWLKIKENIADG
jgi:hypothetical protein